MSYNHELAQNIRDACDDQTNEELCERIAKGDMAARDQLIANSMKLVLYRVGKFLATCQRLRHLKDDITGDCFLAITELIGRIADGKVAVEGRVTPFLSRTIAYVLYDAAHNNEQKTELLNDPTMRSLTYCAFDSVACVDLRDELAACCETNLDSNILRLRQEGYTFEAIAKLNCVSDIMVRRAFKAIEERFNARK